MLSSLRLVPVRRCLRPCPSTSRGIASSASRFSELGPTPPTPEEAEVLAGLERKEPLKEKDARSMGNDESQDSTYRKFMEQVGEKFKYAKPQNWLGGQVPFPMNPSFKPPPPITDRQRSEMYKLFMSNPDEYSVRELSQRYGISLKRVDAILRLKGLEEAWKKEGKQLQTGFTKGMELILNASQSDKTERTFVDAIRYDVHEADTLEAEERRDAARQRYQRSYWESVPEDGREPILPGSLEHAKAAAKRYVERGDKLKASPRLMPRIPENEFLKQPKELVQIFEKPGRPTFKFVDVGAKFMDVDERIHRMTTAGRNSKRRLQRSLEKEELRRAADVN